MFGSSGQLRLGCDDLGLPFAAFSFRHGVPPVGRGGSRRSLLKPIELRLRLWLWPRLPINRRPARALSADGVARLSRLRPSAMEARVVTLVQHWPLRPPRLGGVAAVARTRRLHGRPTKSVTRCGLVAGCWLPPPRQFGQVLVPERCHARVQPGVFDELSCPRLITLTSGSHGLVEDALGVDLGAVPLPYLCAGRVECGGLVGELAGTLEIPCPVGSVGGDGRPVSQDPVCPARGRRDPSPPAPDEDWDMARGR